jgi:hypothetical protein
MRFTRNEAYLVVAGVVVFFMITLCFAGVAAGNVLHSTAHW